MTGRKIAVFIVVCDGLRSDSLTGPQVDVSVDTSAIAESEAKDESSRESPPSKVCFFLSRKCLLYTKFCCKFCNILYNRKIIARDPAICWKTTIQLFLNCY